MRRVPAFFLSLFVLISSVAAWTQDVYVWQRQSNPELTSAMQAARPFVAGFAILAAEVDWTGDQARVIRTSPDPARLVALRRPVGLVLRIGPYRGPFGPAAQRLAEIAGSVLVAARSRGLEPSELQLDFDCAESKLPAYRSWLAALRPALGGVPLVFTALPSWLKQPAFADLARASDGFVLQVHSLEKPSGLDQPFSLCDPVKALAWARQAAKVGVAFRIALPTYGYRLAFDPAGRFFSLAAEETPPAWPAGTRERVVMADAAAMARLARALAADPPPNCRGLIWFRLPVSGDRLNWSWITLAAVIRGEIPASKFDLAIEWPEPGLAEIIAVNTGQSTDSIPARVVLTWNAADPLIAADGIGGFRLEARGHEGHAEVIAVGEPSGALLAPRQRKKIAWLRFSREISFSADFVAAPP